MIDPWCDWDGLNAVAEEKNEGAAHVPPPPQSREDIIEAERVQAHLQTADYIHQQRAVAKRGSNWKNSETPSFFSAWRW